MNTLRNVLLSTEKILGSISIFGILILLTISVGSRYIFKKPVTWTDEFTTFVFIFMTFLGASCSITEKSELIVNVLCERFPHKKRQFDYFLNISRMLISTSIIYSGFKYYLAEKELAVLTPLCQLPYKYIALLVPFFGLLIFIKSIIAVYELKTKR